MIIRRLSLLAASSLAVFMAGCSGHYFSLPDERRDESPDIKVTPIDTALVTTGPVEAPAPTPPPAATDGTYIYRVAPGDILDITVPSIAAVPSTSAAGFTSPGVPDHGYAVAPDGSIYVPYVGPVAVQGLSIREVQDKVISKLSAYIRKPQVTVSVSQYRSQKVLVAGQVPKPTYLPITDVPLTLIAAVTVAGNTPSARSDLAPRPVASAQGTGVMLEETGDYNHVQLFRGQESYTVDVRSILKSGDLRKDVLLKDGDVVYVPPVRRSYVFVLGELRSPSLLEVADQKTSLAEVLMASGSFNQQTANASRVYVIRGNLQKPQVFQLDANEPDAFLLADAFPMQPRDVVYVSEAGISRWNRFLTSLLPTIQSLLTAGILNRAAQ